MSEMRQRSVRRAGAIAAVVLLTAAMAAARAAETEPADLETRVGGLIAQLGAEEFATRNAASQELRTIGFPAFARLRTAADSPDAETAKRARELIGPYDKILALLDKLPRDWHTTLYYHGLTETQSEIVKFGGAVAPYLADRFKREKEPLYRFNCVTILNAIQTPEAIALLRELARDQHPWARVESVWALGNAKDAESLPLLAQALEKDTDEGVRKEAVIAIGKIAGIRLLVLLPDGVLEYTSAQSFPAEARKELQRVVDHFMKHKALPEAEKIRVPGPPDGASDGGAARNALLVREALRESLKDDWKVKSFSIEGGKALWVAVRLDKDPREVGEGAPGGEAGAPQH